MSKLGLELCDIEQNRSARFARGWGERFCGQFQPKMERARLRRLAMAFARMKTPEPKPKPTRTMAFGEG